MGRNTLRRQLERALQQQKEYEQVNFEKLEASRKAREEAARIKQEMAKKAAEEEKERQRKIAEERQRMQEQARKWAEAALEKQKKGQERKKNKDESGKKRRSKKPKKTRKGSPDGDDEEMEGDASAWRGNKEERTKRKRRVARGNAISSEKVVDIGRGRRR